MKQHELEQAIIDNPTLPEPSHAVVIDREFMNGRIAVHVNCTWPDGRRRQGFASGPNETEAAKTAIAHARELLSLNACELERNVL